MIKLNITKRARMADKFIESEPDFPNKFELANEMTSKYEYHMKGRVQEIQIELQKMTQRLDTYMEKFQNKVSSQKTLMSARSQA